jgi:hypothetical protein
LNVWSAEALLPVVAAACGLRLERMHD